MRRKARRLSSILLVDFLGGRITAHVKKETMLGTEMTILAMGTEMTIQAGLGP